MAEISGIFGKGGRLYADSRIGDDSQPAENPDVGPPAKVEKSPDRGAPPASSRPGLGLQSATSTILEVAGLGLVSAGCFVWSTALGLIVSGLSMVLVGVATGDSR
jgi:hypothetical protein